MARHAFIASADAPAVKLVTSRRRQVASMAPRILLSSKESIFDQAPGRKVDLKAGETARMSIRNRLSHRTPSDDEISVCPGSGNPYKRPDFPPIPINS
jgi:hypothetical protein